MWTSLGSITLPAIGNMMLKAEQWACVHRGKSTLSMAECAGGENLSGSGWHPGGTAPALDHGLQISCYEFKLLLWSQVNPISNWYKVVRWRWLSRLYVSGAIFWPLIALFEYLAFSLSHYISLSCLNISVSISQVKYLGRIMFVSTQIDATKVTFRISGRQCICFYGAPQIFFICDSTCKETASVYLDECIWNHCRSLGILLWEKVNGP